MHMCSVIGKFQNLYILILLQFWDKYVFKKTKKVQCE